MSFKSSFLCRFAKVDKAYTAFSNVMSHLSGICLFAAMMLAFVDILLAKLFNSGVPGQYELIQMLSVPMLYLTLSYTQLTRDQIKLTLLLDKIPHVLSEIFIYAGYVLGVFMSFFMAWHSFRYVLRLFSLHSLTSGVLNLPQWPFCMMLVIGCFFLGIAYIFSIIRRAIGYNANTNLPDSANLEDGIASEARSVDEDELSEGEPNQKGDDIL